MGATGEGSGLRNGESSTGVFGIRNAREIEGGKIPAKAGFSKEDSSIIVSANSDEGKDIVFQFKLGRGDTMNITAYDPNVPSKGRTSVSAERPSLDSVINNPKSSNSDKQNAMKIRDMMQRTESGIKESSLGRIANELKKKALKKGRK